MTRRPTDTHDWTDTRDDRRRPAADRHARRPTSDRSRREATPTTCSRGGRRHERARKRRRRRAAPAAADGAAGARPRRRRDEPVVAKAAAATKALRQGSRKAAARRPRPPRTRRRRRSAPRPRRRSPTRRRPAQPPAPRRLRAAAARRGHRADDTTAEPATGGSPTASRDGPGPEPAAAEPRRAPADQTPASASTPVRPGRRRVSEEQIAAVVDGWSHDPHGMLGAHPTATAGRSATLRPDAASVAVVDRTAAATRPGRLHDGGVFEAAAAPAARRLPDRGRLPDGDGGTTPTRSTTRTAGCPPSASSTCT